MITMNRKNIPTKKNNRRRAKRRGQMSASGAVLCMLSVALGVFLLFTSMNSAEEPVENGGVEILSAQVLAAQAVPMIYDAEPISTPVPTATLTPEPTVVPTPIPTPEPTPEPTPQNARIRFAGDLVVHTNVLEGAYDKGTGSYNFAPYFEFIAESLSDADYTIANVDGVLCGDEKRPYAGYPNFNTPPELIAALKENGVDMLTMANNHALDLYFDGLKGTINNCENYGMDFVGGARSQVERDQAKIVEVNGISIGFLNYTESANRMEKHCDPNATVYGIRFLKDANFESDIRKARNAGADIVVVYAHWGTEYDLYPDDTQLYYAEKIAAAGADVIIGGHPHTVQPAQWLETTRNDGKKGRTLVLYSLGNFLADKRNEQTDAGIIFEFTVQKTAKGYEVCAPKYIPTYICRGGNGKYFYKIVASGQWLNERPEGMSPGVQKKVIAAWERIVDHMGTEVASPAEG